MVFKLLTHYKAHMNDNQLVHIYSRDLIKKILVRTKHSIDDKSNIQATQSSVPNLKCSVYKSGTIEAYVTFG